MFKQMKQRCNNPNNKSYHRYGGRGIRVEFQSADAFVMWAYASGYAPGKHIDREDNDGNYSPDNCRWVDRTVNQNNMSTNTRWTAFGETKTVAEWARDARCVVKRNTFWHRVTRGWDVEESLTTPEQDGNILEAFGDSKTLNEWVLDARCVVTRVCLVARLHRGWNPEEALAKPAQKRTK